MQGYFSVITEIFDDSGRPHTLEHLVFMGSEQYPYKGILDSIANRSFANGSKWELAQEPSIESRADVSPNSQPTPGLIPPTPPTLSELLAQRGFCPL